MTENAIVPLSPIESAIIGGDLARLSPAERVEYYQAVCKSTGLNPLTRPFDYIILNGKMVLYARKDATEQLRKNNKVSIPRLERERMDDVYAVTAYAVMPDGREDSSIGAVNIANLKGDALANALMKAETKAKRRVTLSICGLGWLDETELETIPDVRPVVVTDSGEIIEQKQLPPAKSAPDAEPPISPVMVIEDDIPDAVKSMKSSDGHLYIEMSTRDLSYHANGLIKALRDNHLTDDEKEAKSEKLDAIQLILKFRAAHHGA